MNELNDEQDISKPEGEQDTKPEVDETTIETTEYIDVEELKKKAELANNYKIRAEKAESEAKKLKQSVKSDVKSGDLGSKDIIYLAKANINDDDMEDLLKYASVSKLSVKEAHDFLKPILDVREEQRKTAQATNTGAAKRGTSKMSDETLMSKALKGEMPESDEDIQKLWRIRKGLK